MHLESLRIAHRFIQKYLEDKPLNILDLGSLVVKRRRHRWSYRNFFNNPLWTYTGADVEEGKNVDVVLKDPYKWQFEDNTFDVIISGQTIEHIEFVWVWFVELARVLKHGGLCLIIAPAVFRKHRYPIDTFRYYPDGMAALAKWAGLEVIKVRLRRSSKKTQDTYMVATKI